MEIETLRRTHLQQVTTTFIFKRFQINSNKQQDVSNFIFLKYISMNEQLKWFTTDKKCT